METVTRLSKHLKTYHEKYPECWKLIDSFRSGRGDPLENWPNWCYCPLAGAAAVITRRNNNNAKNPFYAIDVGALGALAAWRVSQGIYRFDKTILNALISTEINDLPIEIFYRLPEWCVYIEVDYHIDFIKCKIKGFLCHPYPKKSKIRNASIRT